MKTGIYKIIFEIDKFYIGSSKNVDRRLKIHMRKLKTNKHENIKLQNFYNKYGCENVSFEILELTTIDTLIEREQHYIDTLKPYFNIAKKCGNVNWGGSTTLKGRRLSEDHRRKIGEANRTREISQSHRNNQSAKMIGKPGPWLGKHLSELSKEKISKSRIGKKTSVETLAKMKESRLKNPFRHSEEHKAYISNALKGKPKSKESIEKMKETKRINRLKKAA